MIEPDLECKQAGHKHRYGIYTGDTKTAKYTYTCPHHRVYREFNFAQFRLNLTGRYLIDKCGKNCIVECVPDPRHTIEVCAAYLEEEKLADISNWTVASPSTMDIFTRYYCTKLVLAIPQLHLLCAGNNGYFVPADLSKLTYGRFDSWNHFAIITKISDILGHVCVAGNRETTCQHYREWHIKHNAVVLFRLRELYRSMPIYPIAQLINQFAQKDFKICFKSNIYSWYRIWKITAGSNLPHVIVQCCEEYLPRIKYTTRNNWRAHSLLSIQNDSSESFEA